MSELRSYGHTEVASWEATLKFDYYTVLAREVTLRKAAIGGAAWIPHVSGLAMIGLTTDFEKAVSSFTVRLKLCFSKATRERLLDEAALCERGYWCVTLPA